MNGSRSNIPGGDTTFSQGYFEVVLEGCRWEERNRLWEENPKLYVAMYGNPRIKTQSCKDCGQPVIQVLEQPGRTIFVEKSFSKEKGKFVIELGLVEIPFVVKASQQNTTKQWYYYQQHFCREKKNEDG